MRKTINIFHTLFYMIIVLNEYYSLKSFYEQINDTFINYLYKKLIK
jgi:hypothetical protein